MRDNCHYAGKYRGAAHSICNFRYKISNKIPIVFHNGSGYDYHFIIKQLAREFKGYFYCLGGNTKKYITFSVPIKKLIDEDKDNHNDNDNDSDSDNDKVNDSDSDKDKDKDKGKGKDKVKTTTYRLKFIDSYRFMQDSLSNLVDSLSGIDNKEPENTLIDNMRFMIRSLSLSIDKISEIDSKKSQIDKMETENKFIDNMRSMITSLSKSIDKVSEIDKKYYMIH